MLPFKKIIFPVDYSPACLAVAPWVAEMVRHFDAELTVVHAGPPIMAYSELMIDMPWPSEMLALEKERLRKFAAANFPGHVDCIVEDGEPGSVVDHVVKHQGADLVMMATHGHGPLRQLLLGSVTAKVLHDVSAAVWTGTGAPVADHKPGMAYKSIVCAVDESEEAEVVLRAAASLADSYKAQLHLLHAVPTPPMALNVDFGAFRTELMDAAETRLKQLKAKLGITAPHTVIDAMIIDGLREEAIRVKADLIVTGRGQSQGTFSRAWSRLYAIVRESPCPVLSV